MCVSTANSHVYKLRFTLAPLHLIHQPCSRLPLLMDVVPLPKLTAVTPFSKVTLRNTIQWSFSELCYVMHNNRINTSNSAVLVCVCVCVFLHCSTKHHIFHFYEACECR